MLRWSEEQLREHHAKRQGKAQAIQEAKDHVKDVPRPKYRNKKTMVDGRTFDSKLEATRYVQLKKMQEAGLIFDLKTQVTFVLEVSGVMICKYIADFTYINEDGSRVVEDVKCGPTAARRDYIIKKKLMMALHRIDIKEFKREKSSRKVQQPV